jgi:hypothetical protein
MPAASIAAVFVALLTFTTAPADASVTQPRDSVIRIEFFDPFDRSSLQFSISEDAYIAVFEVGRSRAELIYPAIGKRPFRFERLNELYEGEGTTLRPRNSLGVVEDLPELLLRAILPDYDAPDWNAYLHWILETR